MSINKVEYFGETLMDISDSTIEPDNVLEGYVGYDKTGTQIVGRAITGSSDYNNLTNIPIINVHGDVDNDFWWYLEEGIYNLTQDYDISAEYQDEFIIPKGLYHLKVISGYNRELYVYNIGTKSGYTINLYQMEKYNEYSLFQGQINDDDYENIYDYQENDIFSARRVAGEFEGLWYLKQDVIDENNKLDYSLIDNTPTIPDTSTFQTKITSTNKLDYSLIDNTPTIPDVSNYVPNTRTVNGKALSSNITLSASDIGAIVFDDTYITNANTFYSVNGYSKTSTSTTNLPSVCTGSDRWGVIFFVAENAANHTGTQMYFPIDGTYKGRIFYRSMVQGTPSTWLILPTKTSELTNDSGFLTSIPDTYATKTYVDNLIGDVENGTY